MNIFSPTSFISSSVIRFRVCVGGRGTFFTYFIFLIFLFCFTDCLLSFFLFILRFRFFFLKENDNANEIRNSFQRSLRITGNGINLVNVVIKVRHIHRNLNICFYFFSFIHAFFYFLSIVFFFFFLP